MDAQPKNIHRFLISTPTRFVGEYRSEDVTIELAWQSPRSLQRERPEAGVNPNARYYFVLSIRVDEPERQRVIIPDYLPLSEHACAILALFFGKRFDNHGLLISDGMYRVPELDSGTWTFYKAPPYNQAPRQDFQVPFNLEEFSRVAPLILEKNLKQHPVRAFNTAARFYLRSLRVFDQHPELAYLDLITCGEILANFYDYPVDELLDDQTKKDLKRISEAVEGGEKVVRRLQGRMRQIKRAYTRTLLSLLTEHFFSRSEATEPDTRLLRVDIEKRLKASYDLRSYYLHQGTRLENLVQPFWNEIHEVPLLHISIEDREFAKCLWRAPTLLGLERIIRYCLLCFSHRNFFRIDPELEELSLRRENVAAAP